ncbi:MAG: hypothetical protein B6D73_04220 [gamma proteobacterium symbiont of Stewartia floridana]|nr:MAG: hypothetical protein B6D73_04220 [gamma proteobacterium symbiont of Stewartia floridana]
MDAVINVLISKYGITVAIFVLLAWIIKIRFIYYYKIEFLEESNPNPSRKTRTQLENERTKMRESIETPKWESIYRIGLNWFFNKLSTNFIGDLETINASSKNETRLAKFFGCNPFTANSYDFSVALAFIYPAAFFTFGWLMGGEGNLGNRSILSASESDKITFMISLSVLSILSIGHKLVFKWIKFITKRFNEGAIGILKGIFLMAIVILGLSILFSVSIDVIPSAGMGGIVLVFLLFLFVIALINIRITGVSQSIIATAAVMVLLLVIEHAGNILFSITLSIWYAVAFTITMTGIALLNDTENKRIIFTLLFSASIVAIYVLTIGWIGDRSGNTERIALIVLIIILPLVNAFVDWISLGFTRGLLYAIKIKKHSGIWDVIWAFGDGLVAILLLLTITSLLTVIIAYMDAIYFRATSEYLFDLQGLYVMMEADPYDPNLLWIHAMVLSTLLWTLIHFILASSAFIFVVPLSIRKRWLNNDENNIRNRLFSVFYISSMPIVGPTLSLIVISSFFLHSTELIELVFQLLYICSKSIAVLVNPVLAI